MVTCCPSCVYLPGQPLSTLWLPAKSNSTRQPVTSSLPWTSMVMVARKPIFQSEVTLYRAAHTTCGGGGAGGDLLTAAFAAPGLPVFLSWLASLFWLAS